MIKAYKLAKTCRSVIVWGLAALICIVMLSFRSYAATAVDPSLVNGFKPGPGDHGDDTGNIVSLSGEVLVDSEGNVLKSNTLNDAEISDKPYEEALRADNYTVTEENGVKIYTFEGKRYKLGSSYGVHKLSGYSAGESGAAMTYSGKTAVARHTVAAASDLPIGTVIIIKGTAGPYSSIYDGMYVVEDRGGYHIEESGWLDIYFDTAAEAAHTTDAGWNYAEAWIAEPLE